MAGRLPLVALTCALSLWAALASACTPAKPTGIWFDQPIRIAKDGSFKNAEQYRSGASFGNAVKDIGNGKIGQRLIENFPCSVSERLLVVDCPAAKVIVINGLVDPVPDDGRVYGSEGSFYYVKNLYQPNGKIRLTRKVTIDGLVAVSKAENYQYQTDVEAAFGGGKKKNRYNPFNGCKLFYPDSAGAKL